MKLFDKLRNMANAIISTDAPTANAVISTDTPTVNRYYGVILTLLSEVGLLTKENIKTFFKVKYNEECDEEALDKALSKFETSVESKRKETWYGLTTEQWREKEKVTSPLKAEEIHEICFQEFKEDVKAQFGKVLETISECPKVKFLKEGLIRLTFSLKLPSGSYYPHTRLAGQAMGEVMITGLREEEPTVKALVVESVCTYVHEVKGIERIYAVALRATHFENFGWNHTDYQTITEEDCREVVQNSHIFQKKINEASPFQKTSIFNTAVYRIKESNILEAMNSDYSWEKWALQDPYFVDAACYHAVQEMTKHHTNSDTSNVESTFNLIARYVLDE